MSSPPCGAGSPPPPVGCPSPRNAFGAWTYSEPADHLGPSGGLLDGTHGDSTGVELVWGDYFLLEAALSGGSLSGSS